MHHSCWIYTILVAKPLGQLGLVRYFSGTRLLITSCRSSREDDNKGYWTSHAETNKSVNERYAAGYAWIYSRSVLYPRWPPSSLPVNESVRIAEHLLLQAHFSGSGYFVCFGFSDLPPPSSLHGDPSRHLYPELQSAASCSRVWLHMQSSSPALKFK